MSFTDNYNLALPVVGGDTGTWGTLLNNGDLSPIDSILGANFPVTINASDVNLSTTQFQNAIFVLTGVLTGNRSLIVPLSPNSLTLACGGRFVVVNNTTGNFNVTVKTSAVGSTGVTVPRGFSAMLYSDQTNVGYATTGLPAFAAAVSGNPNGQLAGTAGSVNTNASLAFDYANGVLYACTTTGNAAGAVWTSPVSVVSRGFDTVVNLGLTVTHTGGNLLNLAIKTAVGADATALTPIIVPFQTVSGANTTGVPTTVNITSALSMTTNATGASLGTTNNVPFRIWFALFNNSGVAVPAMQVCSTPTSIFPVAEYGVASTTAVSGSATSAGVWYTPNGTTITNCAYRLIGYSEYTSGLATAGTYSSDPTNTVLFGPGIKKPGDTVQSVFSSNGAQGSTGNTYVISNTAPVAANGASPVNVTIVPTSPINHVRVSGKLMMAGGAASQDYTGYIVNTTTTTTVAASVQGAGSNSWATVFLSYETSNVAVSTNYALYGANDLSATYFNALPGGAAALGGTANTFIRAEEIMG